MKTKLLNDVEFWGIIAVIDWRTICQENKSYKLARNRLLTSLDETVEYNEKLFKNDYYNIVSEISKETMERVKSGKSSFAKGVRHGADDTHFMDLPAHLIGLGHNSVDKYLDGELVEYPVVECLSYMFHT